MSIGYPLFGIPIRNRYQLGIGYFSPNVFGILLVIWVPDISLLRAMDSRPTDGGAGPTRLSQGRSRSGKHTCVNEIGSLDARDRVIRNDW